MERAFKFSEVITHAAQQVQAEVAVNKEAAFRTVAAFIVVAVEAKVHMKVKAKAERQAMIKKTMIRAAMSNGKASAYSKVVEAMVTGILAQYGQPDGVEVNGFWNEWNGAPSVAALEAKARAFMGRASSAKTMGELCDACGVAYGSNKTQVSNQKALAKLTNPDLTKAQSDADKLAKATAKVEADAKALAEKQAAAALLASAMMEGKHAVLAALLDLSADDQAWVMAAMAAAAPAPAPILQITHQAA